VSQGHPRKEEATRKEKEMLLCVVWVNVDNMLSIIWVTAFDDEWQFVPGKRSKPRRLNLSSGGTLERAKIRSAL